MFSFVDVLLLYLQRAVFGYAVYEFERVVRIVHFATIVLYTVAYNKIVDFKDKVVPCNLCKYLFVDSYSWSFVLNDYARLQVTVVNNRVTSFFRSVQCQANFVSHKGSRVVAVLQKKMYKMLSHPFFGGKGNTATAQIIEDGAFAIIICYFCFVMR